MIVISSGHGKYVRGASGYIDEVDEARLVVDRVADHLQELGIDVTTFHDDTSRTQEENLENIVDFHNSQMRDLDVSVHFNAYKTTEDPMGTEVLYTTQEVLASDVSFAISRVSGLINRGAKYHDDLYFLNQTDMPAILIEVCFVDSGTDVDLYQFSFDPICRAIAFAIGGYAPGIQTNITASVFGGEEDYNVSAYDDTKVLNDTDFYVALPDRFEGKRPLVKVLNRQTRIAYECSIEDVGPWNTDDPYWDKGTRPQAESGTDMSGRPTNGAGIDLSPALAKAIGVEGMGLVDWRFVK